MADPLEYQIVKAMQAALQGISKAGGYHHDIEALAVRLDPNHKVEDILGENPRRPMMVIDLSPDSWDYSEKGSAAISMPFIVHAVNDSDVENDDSRLLTYFRLAADVEKAVALNPSLQGSLAQSTTILERELTLREPEGREVWALIKGTMLSRRRYGSPNGA